MKFKSFVYVCYVFALHVLLVSSEVETSKDEGNGEFLPVYDRSNRF